MPFQASFFKEERGMVGIWSRDANFWRREVWDASEGGRGEGAVAWRESMDFRGSKN